MIFLHFLWPLLVFNSPGSTLKTKDGIQEHLVEDSQEQRGFPKTAEKFRDEFQEMWSSYGGFEEQNNQKLRDFINDKLDCFGQKPGKGSKLETDQENWTWLERADAWCRINNGNQKSSDGQKEESTSKQEAQKVSDNTIIHKKKVTQTPSKAKDSVPSHLDLELKQVQQGLGDCPVPDGDSENTLNSKAFPQTNSKKLDHETNYKSSKTEHKASGEPDSLDRLISGQLSKEIVAAVFEAVRMDPELKPLLPILEENLKPQKQPKKFHHTEKDIKKSYLEQLENMECDSEKDHNQKCPRDCNPLPLHLQEFYDLVLKTADEERKASEKKKNSPESKKMKKLQRQHQDLPLGDHLDGAEVHDEL